MCSEPRVETEEITRAAQVDSAKEPNRSEPMPAMSPTLSPTLSARHPNVKPQLCRRQAQGHASQTRNTEVWHIIPANTEQHMLELCTCTIPLEPARQGCLASTSTLLEVAMVGE